MTGVADVDTYPPNVPEAARIEATRSARPWQQAPANGSITATDVGTAVAQLGHSCA